MCPTIGVVRQANPGADLKPPWAAALKPVSPSNESECEHTTSTNRAHFKRIRLSDGYLPFSGVSSACVWIVDYHWTFTRRGVEGRDSKWNTSRHDVVQSIPIAEFGRQDCITSTDKLDTPTRDLQP